MAEKNEFESMGVEEDFPAQQEFSGAQGGEEESLISAKPAGEKYKWENAPTSAKAPPRVVMDGMEVVIEKAEMFLPPLETPWSKTRKGDKECKYVTFKLTFSEKGQVEHLSGCRIFNTNGKYSHPTITNDRGNQSSELKGLYADFKKKDINEVSMFEFMNFLNSKPRVVIKTVDVRNPTTNAMIKKNMIAKFV